MLKKYNAANPTFVNTSEAYSKAIFFSNDQLVIPYINVGILPDNPINNKQSVIDYCYYLITGVKAMSFGLPQGDFNISLESTGDSDYITEYIIFGNLGSSGAEVKILCSDLFLYISDTSVIRSPQEPFIPINTPLFKSNMSQREVDDFFKYQNFPKEIFDIVDSSIYSIVI